MNAFVKRYLVVCIFIVLPFIAFSQSKKELESRKAKIQKEIDFTNKQLQIVTQNKSATAEQLAALRKKIELRQSLIGTINSEINTLGGEIENTSKEIVSLEEQMSQLKTEYAAMIRYAYHNRNVYQRLMFVFAAQDFNQAYSRLKYLQQYGVYRRDQAFQIDATQTQLSGKKQELVTRKNEKTALRNTEQQQKSTLEKEKKQQDVLLQNLSNREKKLKKQFRKRRT